MSSGRNSNGRSAHPRVTRLASAASARRAIGRLVRGGADRLGYTVMKKADLEAIVSQTPSARRVEVGQRTWAQAQGRVLYGPFAGQLVSGQDGRSWPHMAAKILGLYRPEIHAALGDIVRQSPALVLNLGCGDGYFAVGLARLLPEAEIWAQDDDERSIAVTVSDAELNGIGSRLSGGTHLSFAGIQSRLLTASPAALLVSVEGLERELLNPSTIEALRRAIILVEVHDHLATGSSSMLLKRFDSTHVARWIEEGVGEPGAVPELQRMSPDDRWLVVSDGGTHLRRWLWLTPRNGDE